MFIGYLRVQMGWNTLNYCFCSILEALKNTKQPAFLFQNSYKTPKHGRFE